MNFHDICANVAIPDIGQRMYEQPHIMLPCMGIAISEVAKKYRTHSGWNDPLKVYPPIRPRIVNLHERTCLMDLKVNLVGRLISIAGTIVKVGNVRPFVERMSFICESCGHSFTIALEDGKADMPSKCGAGGCRSKKFTADQSTTSETVTIDWQKVRLQEQLCDDQLDSGRAPRTLDCELMRDLVDSVVPGDVVVLTGIVKLLATDEGRGKAASQMYSLYLDVNSIGKANNAVQDAGDDLLNIGSKDSMTFSDQELYLIREISQRPDLFKDLVNSLCPAIYGHEIVKAGLLLTLFGGRRRDEEKGLSIRSYPHILIVGDPGLGKSQMLMATVKLAPRGVYVSGNSTTTSGLTVTLAKDPQTGETTLEAGALVLGDQGVCCIDEFDKMKDHTALLEAMEQQSVSVAKSGVICTLPARTSVIAAANPVGGHYNKSKSVSENLKMNGALLSRFDLVFILLDKPDAKMDEFLSNHIMKVSYLLILDTLQFQDFFCWIQRR